MSVAQTVMDVLHSAIQYVIYVISLLQKKVTGLFRTHPDISYQLTVNYSPYCTAVFSK